MIVGKRFAGDDEQLIKLQDGAYGEALTVLKGALARQYRNACLISGVPLPEAGWPNDPGLDHRTVQAGHDLLAAAWRFSVRPPEPPLPLAEAGAFVRTDRNGWFDWLRNEVCLWAADNAELIRLFVRVMQNQNCEVGYIAEAELSSALQAHYRNGEMGR